MKRQDSTGPTVTKALRLDRGYQLALRHSRKQERLLGPGVLAGLSKEKVRDLCAAVKTGAWEGIKKANTKAAE